MTRKEERAFVRSAQQYHAAPVTMTDSATPTDDERRYDVVLDPWDNPERAARDLARRSFLSPRSLRRIGRGF